MPRWLTPLAILAACAAPIQADQDGPAALRIAGDGIVTGALLPQLAASHSRTHEGTPEELRFQVEVTSSSEAFARLLRGEIDLAATTRKHSPAEQEQAVANKFDLSSPDAHTIVAVNMVGISVNAANPLGSLTYDQVIGMFCKGSIDNWNFLGLDERPITVLVPGIEDGSRALFEDFFCGPAGLTADARDTSAELLTEMLRTDPGAIGFHSLTQNVGKLLKLRPDAGSQPVAPTQQNIIRGAYPLAHDLYLYGPGPITGDAERFIEWVASPAGQDVVDEARFLPLFLRPERMDAPRPLRETIHFEAGKSVPTMRSQARLDLLVEELRDRAGEYSHVILEGYADNAEASPVGLSRARAVAVENLLKVELPGLFYEIIPRGAQHPIAPNETPYGRQRNRRVQIYLAEEERGNVQNAAPEDPS